MKVTKSQIIEALKTEPLKAGSWYTIQEDDSCSVCAVGAVLRSAAKMVPFAIEIYASENYPDNSRVPQEYFLQKLFKEGRYMEALSCVFEDACEDKSLEEGVDTDKISEDAMTDVRSRTIKFVEENFPEEVKI